MLINGFLFISKSGGMRILKSDLAPKTNEIRIALSVNIPERFFKRPEPVVSIDIPEAGILDPEASAIIDISAKTIAEKLGLDVTDVADGLRELIPREGDSNGG